MRVRPISLRNQPSFDDYESSHLSSPSLESGINRSRYDLAADLIAKGRELRRLHAFKVKKRTPKAKQTTSSKLMAMLCDKHETTISSELEDEGPSLPGFVSPIMISVKRRGVGHAANYSIPRSKSIAIKVTEIPGSLSINSSISPIHKGSASPMRRSPMKANGLTPKLKKLKIALMQNLSSPKLKRLQTSKATKPENYFLQKPRRRLSLKTSSSSAYWLARKFSDASTEMPFAARIFDPSQVIRVTNTDRHQQ